LHIIFSFKYPNNFKWMLNLKHATKKKRGLKGGQFCYNCRFIIVLCFVRFAPVYPFFFQPGVDFKINVFQTEAKSAYEKFVHVKRTVIEKRCKMGMYRCGLCGCSSKTFQLIPTDFDRNVKKIDISSSDSRIGNREVWKLSLRGINLSLGRNSDGFVLLMCGFHYYSVDMFIDCLMIKLHTLG
jgi:hypothetical protein